MIRLSDVRAGYGGRAVLQDVQLHVRPGQFVGLLGPNGAGKTTLVRLLSGVLPLLGGRAILRDQDIQSLECKSLARLVATVPQSVEAVFDLTVEQLVRMGRYPWLGFWSAMGRADLDAVRRAMELAGVVDLARRSVATLSGGELQRVLLARALAQDTPLLLLDEAASHLDPARRTAVFDLLARLNAQGRTIVTVIHDLNLAALYCRRLVFLRQGRVVLDGDPETVFTQENLESIYDTPIRIIAHPETGRPQALLVPGPDPVGSGGPGGDA